MDHPKRSPQMAFVPIAQRCPSIGNAEKQEIGRRVNNRLENRHLHFRRRERAMSRSRQTKALQKFYLGPCLLPQPLRFGTSPHRSADLQSPPLGRTGRVAVAHGLKPRTHSHSYAKRRRAAIRLTALPCPLSGGRSPFVHGEC